MVGLYTRFIETGYKYLSSITPLTAWKHFEVLQRNQWLQYDELARIRWLKLHKLLQYSLENVPYYQRIWREHGVDPSQFASEKDLLKLPTVSKESLTAGRVNGEFPLDNKKYQLVQTSGTTGQVFQVPFTLDDFQKKYAAHLRQVYASRWRLGMKSATLYHSGHPQFGGKFSGEQEKDSFVNYRKLALKLAHRRLTLPPYSESESGNDHFPRLWYNKLRRYKPQFLETLEFNLPALMAYIDKEGLDRLQIPIIYVLGTLSEKLRLRYERFFSAKVFNRYAPHEVEGVAFACDLHKGMHMSIDAFHIEFLNDHGRSVEPNTIGHITITDLENYTMPLIRYKIGDLGFFYEEPCPCGRGLPLMGDIAGRTKDALTLKNGRCIAPSDVTRLLQDDESISLFQVIQNDANTIYVHVVPKTNANRKSLRFEIAAKLHDFLGESNNLIVRVVEKIHLEPNGKICLVKRTK